MWPYGVGENQRFYTPSRTWLSQALEHTEEKRSTCRQSLDTHKPHMGESYLVGMFHPHIHADSILSSKSGLYIIILRDCLSGRKLHTPRHIPNTASTHSTKPHNIRNPPISADQYRTTAYHKHACVATLRQLVACPSPRRTARI